MTLDEILGQLCRLDSELADLRRESAGAVLHSSRAERIATLEARRSALIDRLFSADMERLERDDPIPATLPDSFPHRLG